MPAASSGMGFLAWLTLLFVGLKLANYIDWSWVWVLAPLWIGWTALISLLLVIGVIAALVDD